MNKIHFKTNINCNSCIQKVTPILDEIKGIKNWSVDTDNAQKILTVETESATAEKIIEGIQDIGFDIAKL
jgi:copper chaperone